MSKSLKVIEEIKIPKSYSLDMKSLNEISIDF
jgi:hypothetical protein